MAEEIERKFLVHGDGWREVEGEVYRQGYLNTQKERTVRVRVHGERALLTIKGENEGAVRVEYEYEIPLEDANEMLDQLCERPLIEKKRYKIDFNEHVWEVDEFFGDNDGLIVAEVELESEDADFEKPEWIAEEVTDDPRYYNANLVGHPYKKWDDKEKG